MEIGKKYDITLKPATLRGWRIIRETKKCFAIEKTSYFKCAKGRPYHHSTYLPKKSIIGFEEIKGDDK